MLALIEIIVGVKNGERMDGSEIFVGYCYLYLLNKKSGCRIVEKMRRRLMSFA